MFMARSFKFLAYTNEAVTILEWWLFCRKLGDAPKLVTSSDE